MNENVRCDPSLGPSRQDGSNDDSQYMFFMKKYELLSLNYPFYPFLSGVLPSVVKSKEHKILCYNYLQPTDKQRFITQHVTIIAK